MIEAKALGSSIPHYAALDGWRAISILLVMAGHLFPLGPKFLRINESAAALGMAIFFMLSGFLITTTLLYRPSVKEFLIRRLCRILPLAWVFTIVALTIAGAPAFYYIAQLLFFSNLPPFYLTPYTGHLWSLCVEMQFYACIALIFWLFGKRGLWFLPIACLLVTAHRIQEGEAISIVTSVRVDEILAGGILALIAHDPRFAVIRYWLTKLNVVVPSILAALSASPLYEPLEYVRPYLVGVMVGQTILDGKMNWVSRQLQAAPLAYIAKISYALYILHVTVTWGWAGHSKLLMYELRLPELMLVFALAHASTFYFEDFWIRLGKQFSTGLRRMSPPLPQNPSRSLRRTHEK